MRTSSGRQRGMALVMVLWLAAAIAAWCTAVLALARDSGLSQRTFAQLAAQRVAAASAVELAAARLRDPSSVPLDQLRFGIGERQVEIVVSSESSKVDLNAASPELLALIIGRELVDDPERVDALAQAIVDWRDEDDLRQLEGAEADEYRREGSPFGPANGPFRHVAELRGVLGMNDTLFRALAPHLTVLTGEASPSGEDTLDLVAQLEGDADDAGEADNGDPAGAFAAEENAEAEPEEVTVEADGDGAAEAQPSEVAAAENIYRLDVTVHDRQGGTYRASARIWTEPPDGERSYETLVWEPFSLPPDDEDDE